MKRKRRSWRKRKEKVGGRRTKGRIRRMKMKMKIRKGGSSSPESIFADNNSIIYR